MVPVEQSRRPLERGSCRGGRCRQIPSPASTRSSPGQQPRSVQIVVVPDRGLAASVAHLPRQHRLVLAVDPLQPVGQFVELFDRFAGGGRIVAGRVQRRIELLEAAKVDHDERVETLEVARWIQGGGQLHLEWFW